MDGGDNSAGSAGAAYVFVRSVGNWSQQAFLKASNTEAGDWFGYSVALSGDTVVVAAPFEDSSATGVNGNGGDNSAGSAGAASRRRRTLRHPAAASPTKARPHRSSPPS